MTKERWQLSPPVGFDMIYYKNLDFLRFFAVSLVILQHWILKFEHYIDLGAVGVTIFFVLSGFLITKILLKSKTRIELGDITLTKALINFYVRRTLRIFPVYYALLAFLFFFSYKTATDNAVWFLTYSSNIKTYLDQNWLSTLGPIWSLAVEEQFYLIWPALILNISKRKIKLFLVLCVSIGWLFRLMAILFALANFDDVNLRISSVVLVTSNIDLFALGGLLAYFEYNKVSIKTTYYKLLFFANTLLFVVLNFFSDTIFYHTFFVFTIGLWSVYLIDYLIKEEENVLQHIFQFKPFSYLGKISYGLYLFHGPFFFIFAIISFTELKLFGVNILFDAYHNTDTFVMIKNISYLILIASLSWFLFEKPINNLKRYFA